MAKGVFDIHGLPNSMINELRIWLKDNMKGKWEIFEVKVIKELWLNDDDDIALYISTWS